MRTSFSRRGFLEILGLATGGVLLRHSVFPGVARAATPPSRFLLMVYFEGAWDQLLALDPRDATQAKYQRVAGKPPTTGVEPAYAQTAAETPFVDGVLTATGGRGIQTRGNLTFGPAMPDSLLAHAPDLCIVRGMNMDTLTHEVGRRYLLTGKFPRGLVASGSSLNTVVAAQSMVGVDIPNIAINVETYNEGLAPAASAVRVNGAGDMLTLMQRQGGTALPSASEAALTTFQHGTDTCEHHGYDATGLVEAFKTGQDMADQLMDPAKAALFNFRIPAPTPLVPLYDAFGITTSADLSSMKARAAVAGQALTSGTTSVVAVTLASGLDDHFDLFSQQAVSLQAGFDALGKLIAYLKSVEVPGTGQSFWSRTTMMVFSEFARTPLINAREGRDHHLTSSCLLAGPGIAGNTVFGASTDQGMGSQKFNFATGAVDPGGELIRPADVHATVLDSMGLSYQHISNQSPRVIGRIRRS